MNQEIKEINLLLGIGEPVKIGGETFSIQKMTLSRLLRISRLTLRVDVDENGLGSENPDIKEATIYQTVVSNAEICAEIVATALVPDLKNAEDLERITEIAMDNLQPSELVQIVAMIIGKADFANFTTSTLLINGNPRPTQAEGVD